MPQSLRLLWEQVEASPLGSRLAKGAFWSLSGALISRGLGIISWILVGRLLGKEGFGELGVLQSTVGMFGTVAGFGMGMAATKYVAEFRTSDPARAGRIIGLASLTTWVSSGLMALILAIFAPWIAVTTLAAPQLADALRVGSLLLLLGGVTGAQSGALSGFEAFRSISRVNLIAGFLTFPLMLAGAWFAGVMGAVWAMAAAAAINCVLNWAALRSEARDFHVPVSYASCFSEWSIFWSFNVPGVINAILYAFVGWAGMALVVQYPEGYADIGVYNAALRIKQLPEIFVGMILAPILPVLSDGFARKDMATCRKTLVFAYSVCTLVIVPISLLQTAAPMLTLLPFGASFSGGEGVVPWLMLSAVAYALMWPMGLILISLGRIWLALFIGILYVSLYLGLATAFIPMYGVAGFACAGAVAFIVANLPCVYLLYVEFPALMKQTRWAAMAAVASTLFGLSWLAFRGLSTSVAIVVGAGGAAVFALWRLKTLSHSFRPADLLPS